MSTEFPSEEQASTALWAKCPKCGHCWAAAYYPLDLATVAKLALEHSNCPKCGTAGVVAAQHDGVLKESDREEASHRCEKHGPYSGFCPQCNSEQEERLKKPSCVECGAKTQEEAATLCICSGDKDHCHGCDLWPD